jgi:hypothetical protein
VPLLKKLASTVCLGSNMLCLAEENSLRVFENRVLRRICGRKRDEVTGVEETS